MTNKLNRRQFLKAVSITTAAITIPGCVKGAKKSSATAPLTGQKPNIVYILWDDQPFGSVGFPGIQKNLGYETPNLNKMAEEGKVSIRHARHKARDGIQALVKEHELGEDEGRRQTEELEKLTHKHSEAIEAFLKKKEEEVMSI